MKRNSVCVEEAKITAPKTHVVARKAAKVLDVTLQRHALAAGELKIACCYSVLVAVARNVR